MQTLIMAALKNAFAFAIYIVYSKCGARLDGAVRVTGMTDDAVCIRMQMACMQLRHVTDVAIGMQGEED